MRRTILAAAAVAILVAVNWSIASREAILERGKVVRLELAPVDPRSLMQGDYMALRYRIASEAFDRNPRGTDGHVVVTTGADGVAKFVRLDDGTPLAPGEIRLRYRWRDGPRFATNAYFFEEGTASRYGGARFGEFRVGGDGEMILTRLLDAGGKPL